MNVGSLLTLTTARLPSKIGLVGEDRRVSYHEFNKRVNQLANKLITLHVGKGDKVALYLHNSMEWAEIYYALSKIGGVIVPINFRIKGQELAYVIDNSDTRILFFDLDLRENVEAVKMDLEKVKTFILVGDIPSGQYPLYKELFINGLDTEPGISVSEEDIHSICYTSGTTGLPKGAVLTNMNVFTVHYLINSVEFGLTRDDVILATTPLSQRIGWGKLITCIGLGCKLIIMRSFDAEKALNIIEKEKVTSLSIVPTIGRLMLQVPNLDSYTTGSLKSFLVSGEAFPIELKEALGQKFPRVKMFSCYASTEAGQVTNMTNEDMLEKSHSVGCPISSIEVKIVDEKGEEVKEGEVGEIIVKSGKPGMFGVIKEYYKDAQYTKEYFLGDWLRTGDMGKTDHDGYLYLVDRKKDMIVSGGYNIYSKEVEMILEGNEKLVEAAVIGVPDEQWGEAVKAFVVLKKGAVATQEEIIEFCKARLASYKKPKFIEFIDSLPRNALGKVQKFKLKASDPALKNDAS
jgi:long-chain acyl-CoA synthetase